MRHLTFKALIIVGALFFAFSNTAMAWGRGWGWGYHRHYVAHWHSGHWYHSPYGWWWVVGPTWYFYNVRVADYPPTDVTNVYYVQSTNGAPPPPPPNAAALTQPPPSTTPTAIEGVTPSPPPVAPASPSSTPPKLKKNQALLYYCSKTKSYFAPGATCASGWIAIPVAGPK